jgi:hypothetical protein
MDRYLYRRVLLEAVREYDPAPVTVEDVAGVGAVRTRLDRAHTSEADLAAELANLERHGYLEDLRPGRVPLYRVTAKATDQLDRETRLDEFLWGEVAL